MKYFAYGSNMDPNRMKSRGANFTSREHAVLAGYSLHFNKEAQGFSAKPGEGKGNIMPQVGQNVEGALYEIAESGISYLDKCEGFPKHYDKITVTVELDDGTKVDTITYIAKPDKIKNGLKPTREYLSHYLKGKDILTNDYYHKLESWPTVD